MPLVPLKGANNVILFRGQSLKNLTNRFPDSQTEKIQEIQKFKKTNRLRKKVFRSLAIQTYKNAHEKVKKMWIKLSHMIYEIFCPNNIKI